MLSINTYAQSSEVELARTEYGKFTKLKQSPSLAKPSLKAAQEAIDKASVHKRTSLEPATWTFRSLIYAEKALFDSTAAAPALTEAVAALAKAKELDIKSENKANIDVANQLIYTYYLTKAIKSFNKKEYAASYPDFVKGLEYSPGDTIAAYYAGASAQNVKDYKSAIKHYNELLSTNFSFLPDVYANLAESHAANKDTAAAIKTLSDGYAKYPKSNQLVAREIEFSINSGKYKDVISKIEGQIQANPTNKFYPFYLGIAYGSLNDLAKAEEAYKKAIAVDPNFIEAYLNAGSLIMNRGIDLYNAANKQYSGKSLTPAQLAQYNAAKKKATAEFDKALPYLQKAAEIDPKSKLALNNLISYYHAKSDKAKVAELEARLKAL